MCRQAGGVLHELREQGRVKFYDDEFRETDGGRLWKDAKAGAVLRGDATPLPTGPVHMYSGRGSPTWAPDHRALSRKGTTVHEVGHTMGLDDDAANKLALDCAGVRFSKT
jgi:hypothetical protein